jgi:hypothetical protein
VNSEELLLRTENSTAISNADLDEAYRYLKSDNPDDLKAFARRQLKARGRTTRMLKFYREHPCHLGPLHMLAACAITLGRFAGFSESYDLTGDAFMPVDLEGEPRTPAWAQYALACATGKSWESRDELWLAAHMLDMEEVRRLGIDAAFYDEAARHRNDVTWRLLEQHMQVTLGVRMMDSDALSGAVAFETAMARSLALTVRHLVSRGISLLWRYALEGARAILMGPAEPLRPLLSYRRTAFYLCYFSIGAWTASRVFRRGMRQRERGARAEEEGWPLLEQALGERVSEIHPEIVRFYTNPSRYHVTASIDLRTLPARLWSRAAALLLGQGLYESEWGEIEARFRVFRRADGSMHFVRELHCGGTLRVFDSDFVIKERLGVPVLFEVFTDLSIEVEMELSALPDMGLRIRGKNVYFKGIRVPAPGLRVEFRSQVQSGEAEQIVIHIDGSLLMEPDSEFGRFVAYRILRRPKELGSIHYRATPMTGP